MKHQQTTVSATTIRMRLANHADPAKATEWLEFEVPIAGLPHPRGPEGQQLGDPTLQYLAIIQQAALRYVRGVISDENDRLRDHIVRQI